ncbi:hypothetical protein [Aquimarina brevivitae]|uniref:Uncharacterized protein n=1 Tax=Aquimarina brevivitae TaxID=323412 RepID=A0A4Q7P362_9FLAO|nr:hypothetical protein [Aquimarina brevivitae]RZS93808.1 hypothetical protein EV197_2389 [Aquimarina brevivitae]
MKKHFLRFTINLMLLGLPLLSMAQDGGENASLVDIEKGANTMCDCMNSFMDQLHPQLKVLVRDMDRMGQEKANQKFTEYIKNNPDQVDQIVQDAAMMKQFEQSIKKIEGCADLNTLLSDEIMQENPGAEEELVAFLRSKSKCEYAYIFYKMGTGKE